MLSISPAKPAGGAMAYFSGHLVEDGQAANPHEDYYQKGSEAPGQWHGAGAETLGLTGDVSAEDMARCLLGIDLDNKKLVQNGGNPERRAGWDLTFSAPKSVSTLWALSDGELREQIADAHQTAVQAALNKLESEYLFSRRGHGGEELEGASLVAATFQHGTSREQDPQLHTHSFLMNLAQRADGSWGTLQSREFFQAKMAVGAFYRAELASQLQSNCGFNIERDGRSFRLAGMSPVLEKQFSKRREKIEKRLDEKGGGRSAKAAEVAALDTRSKKNAISTDELRQSWQDQASELGHDLESIQRDLAEAQPEPLQMPSPESLLAELTEQASTVSKYQLQAAVYTHAQGVLSAEQAERYLDELLHHDELMTLRDHDGRPRYTTHEMYNLEKNLAESAERRGQETHHQASQVAIDQALANRPTITDEQKYMLSHITGREGFAAVQGVAGAGKSFTLGAAREVWEADGKEVIGCALAGKAADGLEESGIKSQTIHSLINDLDKGYKTLSKNSVVVIDEAGMVNSRLMASITDRANEAGAKVLLVGDAFQLQPIDAGGSFRLITEKIGAAQISDIRRQREEWAKQAVRDFSSGEAGRALQAHAERGLVHVENNHDELLIKMVANHIQERDPERPAENLMIAATRRDVAILNQITRAELQASGEVEEDAVMVNGKSFADGDRILFTRNNQQVDVKNGVLGTVLSATDDRFEVMTDAGKRVSFDPREFGACQHGYAITCHKSQSVTVDRAHVLINEGMSDRHWSYVAASRAREQTQFYATSDTWEEAAKTMSRQNLKDTTQDYEIEKRTEQQTKEKEKINMGIVLTNEEERIVERHRKEQEGKFRAVNSQFNQEQKKILKIEQETWKKQEEASKHGNKKLAEWFHSWSRQPAETDPEDITRESMEAPSERVESDTWGVLFEDATLEEASDHTRIKLEDGGVILDYEDRLVSQGVDPETMAEAAAEKFQDLDGPIEITSNDPDSERSHEWCVGVIAEMIENHNFDREDFALEEMGISHDELDARDIGLVYRDLDNDGLTDHLEDDLGLKHDPGPPVDPGHAGPEMMSGPSVEPATSEPVATSDPVQSQPEIDDLEL